MSWYGTKYTYEGKNLTLKEWAAIVGICDRTLYTRLYHGWSIEDTLTLPLITKYNEESLCAVEFCTKQPRKGGMCIEHYTKEWKKTHPETFETRSRRDQRLRLLNNAKCRAAQEGYPFSITKEDIVIGTVCPLLGIPMYSAKGGVQDHSPTLDKIIPRLGYVPKNVHVISMKANRIKSNCILRQLDELRESLHKVIVERELPFE